MLTESPVEIAAAYMSKWENAWNNEGVEATVKLYGPDSVLVGYVTAIGRQEIAELLRGIFAQGWTRITIKVTNATEINGLILAANEYSATGSGPNEGETLHARSSHVLARIGESWLSGMHTATWRSFHFRRKAVQAPSKYFITLSGNDGFRFSTLDWRSQWMLLQGGMLLSSLVFNSRENWQRQFAIDHDRFKLNRSCSLCPCFVA